MTDPFFHSLREPGDDVIFQLLCTGRLNKKNKILKTDYLRSKNLSYTNMIFLM